MDKQMRTWLHTMKLNVKTLQHLNKELAAMPKGDPQRAKKEARKREVELSQAMWWRRLALAGYKGNRPGSASKTPAPRSASPPPGASYSGGQCKSASPPPGGSYAGGQCKPVGPPRGGSYAGGQCKALPSSPSSSGGSPMGMSYSANRCHGFVFHAARYQLNGQLCLTGGISLTPITTGKHAKTTRTPSAYEAQAVFDAVMASASSTLSADPVTGKVSASVASALKVGNVSVGFSGGLSVSGMPTPPKIVASTSPTPISGTVGGYTVSGAIGLKLELTVVPRPLGPPGVPVPWLRTVPRSVPKTIPILPPVNVPVSPILVPKGFFDDLFPRGPTA